MELHTDANGIVTFLPIAEWAVTVVQGKTVGLAFDYYATAADAEAKRPARLQLHLDGVVAQQIGRLLVDRGGMVLGHIRDLPPR